MRKDFTIKDNALLDTMLNRSCPSLMLILLASQIYIYLILMWRCVKILVGAFNQEKALVGDFSVIRFQTFV